MNILAIDASTKCGYALRIADPKKLILGSWKLKKTDEKVPPGILFVRLWKAITALRIEHGIEAQPLQIVVEDASLNAIGGAETKHLAESWVAIVEFYAATKGLPPAVAVGVNSWRSAFLGRSVAPKEIKDPKERRDWIKSETIKHCERRGLKPENDNEADAVGILYWFMNGGVRVQEQRRANKKAKTAAKRAQARINFGAPA